MSRHWLVAVLGVAVFGCAEDRALTRRDEVRQFESALENVDAYRSAEGFGPVRWGMTEDEVRALLPDATPVEEGLLVRNETVAGRPAQVAYVFQQGHLARAVARLRPTDVAEGFDEMKGSLRKQYGQPWRTHDPRHHDEGPEIGAVVAVAVVAALMVGAILLTKGNVKMPKLGGGSAKAPTVHGAVPASASAGTGAHVVVAPDPQAVEAMADVVADSARLAAWTEAERGAGPDAATLLLSSWRTRETTIDLMAQVDGVPELILSYDSKVLRAAQ